MIQYIFLVLLIITTFEARGQNPHILDYSQSSTCKIVDDHFEDEDQKGVSRLLREVSRNQLSEIQLFDLSNQPLTNRSAKIIVDFAMTLPNLKVLKLAKCRFSKESISDFIPLLTQRPKFLYLDIADNRINKKDVASVCTILQDARTNVKNCWKKIIFAGEGYVSTWEDMGAFGEEISRNQFPEDWANIHKNYYEVPLLYEELPQRKDLLESIEKLVEKKEHLLEEVKLLRREKDKLIKNIFKRKFSIRGKNRIKNKKVIIRPLKKGVISFDEGSEDADRLAREIQILIREKSKEKSKGK